MKKLYWIIGIGVTILLVIIFMKVSEGTKPFEVTLDKAELRSVVEIVSATGKIQPETELKITSDVSGEITEMLVKEGDQIKKGTLICRIQPDLYESALDRVNASVSTTKANLKSAEAQLEQAKASLVNMDANFKRNKKLFEQGAISQQEFDAAKAQYESAKANVDALDAGVSASRSNIQSSEATLKEANTNLEKTFIYSPVDGTVYKMNVEKGERVQGVQGFQGTEILRLANLNEMEVSVEVNENDIIKVHKGDTALVEVDAYMNKKFKGIVTEVANSANIANMSIDQVTNFVVKIRLIRESYAFLINEKNPVPFRPGMSASVEIQTLRVSNVVTVPIQAVTSRNKDSLMVKDEDNGGGMKVKNDKEKVEEEKEKKKAEEEIKELVFVIKDGKAVQKVVVSGIQDNEYIQIISGLEKGEEVISGPYSAVSRSLRDGSKVVVVSKKDLYNKD
ncbi:MAG: efflux RND transporter periplasmic adaptor subunit [Bacteroidia bacterium]|nr:efflux RND transporter periplasmic adaptor subunit [Sphingobacteriaceae bacterium]MBK7310232.1 efflux RND transporter periplasmic adaptor subunit [Sphingobacteriaceae bacterium]MBK7816188.1 efflux RND transporter periplasmic adaptor subunit [Sphingobacteriaceae bacterium]MBP9068100.1 efflux RND transporter periplasmic adaptor subunit [Bacteroidia bacterium]